MRSSYYELIVRHIRSAPGRIWRFVGPVEGILFFKVNLDSRAADGDL